MRQKRWLELIKDYDLTINYHLGKMIVVADASSRKSMGSMVAMITSQVNILWDLERLKIKVQLHNFQNLLMTLSVQPTLIDRFKAS